MLQTTTITRELPAILESNTYFWRPASGASGRRANESRRNSEVQNWIERNADVLNAGGFVIDFSYSESCHNVYKRCAVTRNGKRSNLLAVKNWLAKQA